MVKYSFKRIVSNYDDDFTETALINIAKVAKAYMEIPGNRQKILANADSPYLTTSQLYRMQLLAKRPESTNCRSLRLATVLDFCRVAKLDFIAMLNGKVVEANYGDDFTTNALKNAANIVAKYLEESHYQQQDITENCNPDHMSKYKLRQMIQSARKADGIGYFNFIRVGTFLDFCRVTSIDIAALLQGRITCYKKFPN